jgi:membrane-anchored glycerophosphoryl diester phosphodiesterase (GDPDase)
MMIGFTLLFIILWMVYVSSKFYFSEALIYLRPIEYKNSKSLYKIINASFKISQGKLLKILLIIIIIYGFTSILNTIASQPFYFILRLLSELGTALQNPIFYVIVFFLVLIQGIIMCFGNIMFFKSYYQFFKELKEKTKNRL